MDIKLVASFITSITVIVTCAWKMYTIARKLEERLVSNDKNIEQISLYLNKMALLSNDLPLVDRLHAGEWYIAHGGNGIGKKVYEQLLKEVEVGDWEHRVRVEIKSNKDRENRNN